MNQHQFDEDSLKAIEVKDDELAELLERLAATDAMFRDPVTTIADVAEVTEASPVVIARILSDIRGPGEIAGILNRLDNHEDRLQAVEGQLGISPTKEEVFEVKLVSTDTIFYGAVLTIFVALLFAFVFSHRNLAAGNINHHQVFSTSRNNIEFVVYDDESVYQKVAGAELPANDEDRNEVLVSYYSLMAQTRK